MTRKCDLIEKKAVLVGHQVSHSNIKTKKRFLPNLKNFSLISEILGINVGLRLATSTMRTIDKKGGLDKFLLSARNKNLTIKGAKLKRSLKKKLAAVETQTTSEE